MTDYYCFNLGDIFLVFYAIFFGALFTVNDRYRPFSPYACAQGYRRQRLSLFWLIFLPFLYFTLAYIFLNSQECRYTSLFGIDAWIFAIDAWIKLVVAIYAVGPLYWCYSTWQTIVLSDIYMYFSHKELHIPPVSDSISFVNKIEQKKNFYWGETVALYLVIPVSLLLLLLLLYIKIIIVGILILEFFYFVVLRRWLLSFLKGHRNV